MILSKEVQKEKKVEMVPKFRFAPSPSGGLHIGTARTALFNWLAARSMNGRLILRIEDTDIKRSNRRYEASIIDDLRWLGIDWDEFYRQSERIEIYQKYANRLLNEGKAYMCFCSPERLENLRKKLQSEGKMSMYDNKCRNLGEEEIEKNLRDGKKFTIRFKVGEGNIAFGDLIRGYIKFSSEVIGDFIIIKSDGTPSYNFAVVVDDSEMKITHVLRGEDHITNTARQILLFESIGYEIPFFAHISMIMGKDGSKLSKRHGATTIGQFRELGYLSEAFSNYLSMLSWSPKDEEEIFSMADIVGKFRISDISKGPAIFDSDKLNWMNGIYIRKKTIEELNGLCTPFLINKNVIEENDLENKNVVLKVRKCVDAFKDRLKVLSEFPDYVKNLFEEKVDSYSDEATKILKLGTSSRVLKLFLKELEFKLKSCSDKEDIDLNEEESRNIINIVGGKLRKYKIKGKFLYMPLRASLTGKTHGPELPKVISILGPKNCIQRVNQTLEYLEND